MSSTARLDLIPLFYDVLGEDIANELVDWFNAVDLTYRTDLRELNDLNFARFDPKLEQHLAELRADLLTDLRTGLAGLRVEFLTRLHQGSTQVQGVHTELQQVRTELLRWMFGFWVTTFVGIAGLIMVVLRSLVSRA